MALKHPLRLSNPWLISGLLASWLIALWLIPEGLASAEGYLPFSLLGVLGAIFANSTGAGGGVVFIPVFSQLGLTEGQAVATSFGIQSFGITAGAITWYIHYRLQKTDLHLWRSFHSLILICAPVSLMGLWSVYGLHWHAEGYLKPLFGGFSLLLGLFIWTIAQRRQHVSEHSRLQVIDITALVVTCYFGGLLTAWLSVGVGELIAIYLILRRFDITMAVAVAVIVSAVTVWGAMPQHQLIDPQIDWRIVIFAGPGAVIGGIFARTLVTHLSAHKLKVFFAVWLVVLGLVELVRIA